MCLQHPNIEFFYFFANRMLNIYKALSKPHFLSMFECNLERLEDKLGLPSYIFKAYSGVR